MAVRTNVLESRQRQGGETSVTQNHRRAETLQGQDASQAWERSFEVSGEETCVERSWLP